MATVVFEGSVHSFWVDQDGWLQHSWAGHVENMRQYAKEQVKFDPAFPVDAVTNGDHIHVRAVCVTLPSPNGRRLWSWDYTKGKTWVPAASVPKA
jgi:hypothetical protein